MNKELAQKKHGTLKKIFTNEQASLIIALGVLCVVIGLLTPVFFTFTNMMNLFKQTSIWGIVGLGVACQLLIGEIDLTLGVMQAAMGCLMVFLLNLVGNILLALVITMLVGALIGIINGLIITKGKINSFIATLGTMSIIKGATFVLTKAASVENKVDGFDYLGTGTIFGIPVAVIIFIVLAFMMFYVLKFTTFGRKIYAVGGSVNAAKLSGLNVDKIKILVYMITGALVALAAVITASRMNSGQPTTGTGFELSVISAVILGGVSMTGGRGNLWGGVIGILLLNVLSNGLVLLNVSSFYQEIARGIVIIVAVFLDEKRKRDLGKRMLKADS